MNSLVIGASGQVGTALVRALRQIPKMHVWGTSNQQYDISGEYFFLDLAQPDSIRYVLEETQPDIVFVCGAITNVEMCEEDPVSAFDVNVAGLENLLSMTHDMSRVVFISSSYVFDGKKSIGSVYLPNSVPNPIQTYGIQKLMGEELVLADSPMNLVIRIVAAFGPRDAQRKNFAYQVVDALKHKRQFIAPVDQYINPIHVDNLADLILNLVRDGAMGIHHLGGQRSLSKFSFACDIANEFGLDAMLVKPIMSCDMGQLAERPKNGTLSSDLTAVNYYTALREFHREFQP